MTTRLDLIRRSQELFGTSERINSERRWSELSEYLLNNQWLPHLTAGSSASSSGLLSSAGTKKTDNVFDSTALQATQDLASAIQGTLTNPATVWSKLRFRQDEFNNDKEATSWLEEVNKTLHTELSESNFDTESAKAYQSFVAMANMALMVEQEETDGEFKGLRYSSFHLGQVAWSEDMNGRVDTVYRKFSFTARQAIEKWGNSVSPEIMKLAEEKPEEKLDFIHCIFPRPKKEVKLNDAGLAPGDKRPIASVYLETATGNVVEETGYYEMPALITRWGVTPGEVYGRGPGHYALPDVKTLNRLKKRSLEAIDHFVHPPTLVSQRDIMGGLDFRPKGVSVVKNVDGIKQMTPQGRPDVLQFSVEELRASIKSVFFLDKLQPLANLDKKERMSQLEVVKRLEEMAVVLGPTVSRLNSEFLQPLVLRSIKILMRNGKLPELPATLHEAGVDVEIIFVNQLARAQQIQDISNIQQWLQNVAFMAQMKPEVLDNVNADGIAKHEAKILGVPEIAVADTEMVENTRQQRAQQQQAQQQMEAATVAADVASKTDTGGE